MTESSRPLPLPVRLMNLAGAGASRIGLQPIKLGVASLLEKAQANTGLSDFGGDEFRQPLALLIESLEKEAKLSLLGRIVARWVGGARRATAWVLLGSLALATGSAFYAGRHLGINADIHSLISPDLPYTKLRREFEAALPLAEDVLLVVIDAPSAHQAAQAADTLAERFAREPEAFRGVFVPGGCPSSRRTRSCTWTWRSSRTVSRPRSPSSARSHRTRACAEFCVCWIFSSTPSIGTRGSLSIPLRCWTA